MHDGNNIRMSIPSRVLVRFIAIGSIYGINHLDTSIDAIKSSICASSSSLVHRVYFAPLFV